MMNLIASKAQPMAAAKKNQHNSLWWDALRRIQRDRIAMISFAVIVGYLVVGLLALSGLSFTGFDLVNNDNAYAAPSLKHWLGTDIFGRDVFSRAAHGTVTSLTVGLFASLLTAIIGTALGSVAGYFGGKVDDFVVWLYTTIATIPYILLMVAFSFVMGAGLTTVVLAVGLTSWVGLCRLVRAEFIKHRSREYVQGAFALGAGHARRIFLHILPNVFHIVLINISLIFVSAIKSEVILSFLGLGVEPGTPSWGVMIDDAKLELARGVWWGLLAATIFMFFLVLAFNLFNDALRDALDPKLKNK